MDRLLGNGEDVKSDDQDSAKTEGGSDKCDACNGTGVISKLAPVKPGDNLEGNSILYALLKYAVFGKWLPADGVDVQLGSMANAAWVSNMSGA